MAALRIERSGGVATVVIDNPPINLFDLALYTEMQAVAAELEADDQVRVVVLRSAVPGFFIAHFDVTLIQMFPTDLPEATELNDFHRMCERFRTMPKPTVAVIEGRVGGGGSELALSCDMRFAARETAIFNQPEVALGIIPGGSGTVRLSRLVGRSRALESILGCIDVDADTAERWGWVNRSLPAEGLWSYVEALVGRMASFPPHAVAAAKASVLRADKEIESDLLFEANRFFGTLGGPGTQAAMARFMQIGGQTPDGEARLGDLAAELGTAGPSSG